MAKPRRQRLIGVLLIATAFGCQRKPEPAATATFTVSGGNAKLVDPRVVQGDAKVPDGFPLPVIDGAEMTRWGGGYRTKSIFTGKDEYTLM